MAYSIRDVYTFEQFNSMAEFTDSLENNQWKRHNPNKKVKIKGKQTLGIRLQNKGKKGIFVRLDFSKILKEQKRTLILFLLTSYIQQVQPQTLNSA